MKFNGFNGQEVRKAIFCQLLAKCKFSVLAETGTCGGETTGYMAEVSGLPVFSCEVEADRHWLAMDRLAGMNCQLYLGESVAFLKQFANYAKNRPTFFYLDAHWGPKLPLAEEVEIVTSNWKDYVALIDDFKHPTDTGYGFDDYGAAGVICLDLVTAILKKGGASVFLPNTPSTGETGAKRGSAWLCSKSMEDVLKSVAGLTQYAL